MRTKLLALVLVLALVGGSLWFYKTNQSIAAQPTSEQITLAANTGGCYGASCNGKDPSNYCTDGITVAAMSVTDGILELRYSPSCKANWGRYTPYWRDVGRLASQKQSIYARVTVWNPGGPSYGVAHTPIDPISSAWSEMADGTRTACTGVEIVYAGEDGDHESQGWTWGPCV